MMQCKENQVRQNNGRNIPPFNIRITYFLVHQVHFVAVIFLLSGSLYLCGKIIFVYKYRIIENGLHGVQIEWRCRFCVMGRMWTIKNLILNRLRTTCNRGGVVLELSMEQVRRWKNLAMDRGGSLHRKVPSRRRFVYLHKRTDNP
jgi:uncharacterized membrane protein